MRGNSKPFGKWLSPSAEMPNLSGNDFRHARKHQTIREMTFAKRGNAKPFGKRLSPSAEMPNHSGNDFRRVRKCQTTRETTFAMRGNIKPFAEWFAGGPQASKSLKAWFSDFRPFWNVQKRVSCVKEHIKLGKSILGMGSRLKVSFICQGKQRSLLCDFIWPNELFHEIREHKKGYESLLIF